MNDLIEKLKFMEDQIRTLQEGIVRMRTFFEDVERVCSHHRSRSDLPGDLLFRDKVVSLREGGKA